MPINKGDPDRAVREIRYPTLRVDRETAEISGPHPDRARRGYREASMLGPEMEDRGVPQDTQIQLQSRGVEAENGSTSGEPHCRLLDPELARVFCMTMLNWSAPTAPPTLALEDIEIRILDRVEGQLPPSSKGARPLSDRDRPARRPSRPCKRSTAPMSRLTDLHFGAMIGAEIVGN